MLDSKSEHSRAELKRQDRIEKKCKANRSDKNPCMKEQEMSFKCLNDNDYDRDKCTKYFQNYRNCKEFWSKVIVQRKRNNILPYLPEESERASLKEEYAKRWQKKT